MMEVKQTMAKTVFTICLKVFMAIVFYAVRVTVHLFFARSKLTEKRRRYSAPRLDA